MRISVLAIRLYSLGSYTIEKGEDMNKDYIHSCQPQ